ncbi:MAG: lamin tail domain-containing protein [Chloroflexota bacterium]|nr:lamin tail domain-containing protein [Chloroflexota bacterium]
MPRFGTFAVLRVAPFLALIVLGTPAGHAPALAGSVSWPASSGLVVGEVVTRGSAASDQYVELYNASQAAVDLGGLELVYVTASGSTVTRKQAWSTGTLATGAHLLVANSNGKFAIDADGLFSGGFSTTGGTLALRKIGGQVIDSLSWGSASNSFVEGLPGGAPPTGSGLERRPGGSAGNWLDTNDNSADAYISPAPVAQGLAAPPVTPPTAAPSPSDAASPDPTLTASPSPTDSPPPLCPTPSASPTATPTASGTDSPTASVAPTPSGSPTSVNTPTPTPSPAPTAAPTPVPTPQAITIGAARGASLGSYVSVIGRLTTPLGLINDGRGAFIESGGAGIAINLVAGSWPPVAPGTDLLVSGALADNVGQLTIEIAGPGDVAMVGSGSMPAPYLVATGLVCEPFEGRLLAVEGLISADAAQEPDGLRTTIDDGSGPLDVVAPLGSFVQASELRAGARLNLVGVIGQRDLSGLGTSGYRLILRSPDDLRPIVAISHGSAVNAQALVDLVLVAAVLALFAARLLVPLWRRRA